MTDRIDPDRIETTRGERLLTVVLGIFLLIGLLWTYAQLDGAGLRIGLALSALGFRLWLLSELRRRRSRWILVGEGTIGAAAALALVTAVDYLTDVVAPGDFGPLALSLIGTLLTLTAIAALHRYLARRLPGRRVRRGDCPFCGYPGRGAHCEGCGREILAPCSRCEQPRRVGAPHCAACGDA